MSQPAVRRGALVFKGDQPLSKKPKRAKATSDKSSSSAIPTLVCEGRIVSSGTTVQGMETRFKDELEVGDVILVRHPQSLMMEERMVVGVVSQRSLNVDRPFSSDFVSTADFSVRRESLTLKHKSASTNAVKKEELLDHDHESTEQQLTVEQEVKRKLSQQKSVLTYQEKVGPWAYKTVAEKLDKHYSEEELLNLRCKKVHDKYC